MAHELCTQFPKVPGASMKTYIIDMTGCADSLEASRLRREHNELIGELAVKCDLPGAYTVNGYLCIADFNFSSLRARQERAKLLRDRAQTNGVIDWFGALENLCQNVLQAE